MISATSDATFPVKTSTPIARPKVRLRGIALPNEHGSWGILFEPLVAAVAIAFSVVAPFVALLFIGAFLMRQPLRIYLADLKAGRNLPQTAAARKYVLFYTVIFAAGLAGTLVTASLTSLIPLAIVAPLAGVQIYYDVARRSRQLVPELTGAIALSSSAAVIALAAGWTPAAAAALSVIFVFRLIPSILYVRNRLFLEKGKKYSAAIPVLAHAVALLGTITLVSYELCSILTVTMIAVLFVRSLIGLSSFHRKRKAMQIGVHEVIYGALTVLSVILGHYLQV
jgi:YwiC-like protein